MPQTAYGTNYAYIGSCFEKYRRIKPQPYLVNKKETWFA